MNNVVTIEDPQGDTAAPAGKAGSEKTSSPPNKPRPRAKSPVTAKPKPKSKAKTTPKAKPKLSSVDIPAGMPFRTMDEAAKLRRSKKQKPERVHPEPAKDAKAESEEANLSLIHI